jgi:hypothetical protein
VLEKEQLYETGNFLSSPKEVKEDSLKEEKEEPSEKIDTLDNEKTESEEKTESFNDSDSLPYETVSVWNKSRLLLILGFLIVLTALLGGLIYLQQTHQSLITLSKPTPTPTEAPIPTPTPQAVAKSDLSVEVRNGTGTPGQAATVKGLMEGIEYENVTTGNADNTDHTQTEVVFSSKVSADQQKEIKDLLLKSFEAVTTSVENAATKDIVVTTGTEK